MSPDALLEKVKPAFEKVKPALAKVRPNPDAFQSVIEKVKQTRLTPVTAGLMGAALVGLAAGLAVLISPSGDKSVEDAAKSYVLPSCDSEKIVAITSQIMRDAIEKDGHSISEFEVVDFAELYGSVEDDYRFCEAELHFNGETLPLYVRVHWADKDTRDLKIVANTRKRDVIIVPDR